MVVVRTDPGDRTEAHPTTRGRELYTVTSGRIPDGIYGLARLRGVFLENLGERGSEPAGVFPREDERGPELHDVVMRAVGSGENSLLAEAVDYIVRLPGGGSAGFAVADEI